MRTGLLFFAAVTASTLLTSVAGADVQHTIGKGHTLQAIANRYHVSVKSIMEANHLKDPKRLKIGDVLTVPKADAPTASASPGKKDDAKDAKPGVAASAKDDKHDAKSDKDGAKAKTSAHDSAKEDKEKAEKAKTPGVIHIKRQGTPEEADLRLSDHGSKISSSTAKSMEKMLRFPGGASHPIDARLISLLGVVSNHFGSRKIEVVSGFRPYTPTQYTKDSNHNHGKAIDFRIPGVPNEQVRDFCRTLKNTGCGYYPNSTFVHLDSRDSSAFWIDYSKPGEAPRYNAPNAEADEGTSDVQDEAKPATDAPTTPSEAPAVPTMPAAPGVTSPAPDSGEN